MSGVLNRPNGKTDKHLCFCETAISVVMQTLVSRRRLLEKEGGASSRAKTDYLKNIKNRFVSEQTGCGENKWNLRPRQDEASTTHLPLGGGSTGSRNDPQRERAPVEREDSGPPNSTHRRSIESSNFVEWGVPGDQVNSSKRLWASAGENIGDDMYPGRVVSSW